MYAQALPEDKPKLATEIYVQASPGSFNHQAISQLYAIHNPHTIDYHFSGTPSNTFAQASAAAKPAFIAIHNSLISGNLVQASVDAMREFEVTQVTAGIYLSIKMCLLRHRQAVSQSLPLKKIASHPAALEQITRWKAGQDLTELPLPKGTAFAAQSVAEGKLSISTGAIGSCQLQELFPALVAVEKNIQDSDNNRTLFAQVNVSRRAQTLSDTQARAALSQVVAQAQQMARRFTH